jgi:hypothetical protein
MASPAESQDLEVLIMRGRVWAVLSVAVLWGLPHAGAAATQEERPFSKVTGGDELVKEKGRFRETWVRPDADITRYDKLHVWNAVFQFRDVGEARGSGTTTAMLRSTGSEAYPIAQESRERFGQVVTDTFVEELQRSKKFQVVDDVGPGTLLVRGAVFDIVSNVPPGAARHDVYLSAVGEATIVIELIDAETGVMLARVGERRRIQPPGAPHDAFTKPANEATVWADVRQWARAVASDFRRELEKAQKDAQKK